MLVRICVKIAEMKSMSEPKKRGGNRAVIGQLTRRRKELITVLRPIQRQVREIDAMLAKARAGLI